jgi:hypothetical protein
LTRTAGQEKLTMTFDDALDSVTWRTVSAQVIYATIQAIGTEDVAALNKALREAYPFGEQRYWPYKVWCDEQRRILRKLHVPHGLRPRKRVPVAGQGELFPCL